MLEVCANRIIHLCGVGECRGRGWWLEEHFDMQRHLWRAEKARLDHMQNITPESISKANHLSMLCVHRS